MAVGAPAVMELAEAKRTELCSEDAICYSPKCVEEEFSEVRGSNLPCPGGALRHRDGATRGF